MSESEITKNSLPTGGLKVHDILADYFTKDLKVKAAQCGSSTTLSTYSENLVEDSASEGSHNGENKKHHHHRRSKKHKKCKKRKKSPRDDDNYLLEQYKKRKLEYEELVRQEEIEKKNIRRISIESGSSKEESSSKKRLKHHERKRVCKRHHADNDREINSNNATASGDKKYENRKKLSSAIALVKDNKCSSDKKEITWKLETITIDPKDGKKDDESDIEIVPESLEKDNFAIEKDYEKVLPEIEEKLVFQTSENKLTFDENENLSEDPVKTTANDVRDSQDTSMEKIKENSKAKSEEKDLTSNFKKPTKISIKNLKNLDLPNNKEVEPTIDSTEQMGIEEGEVVDSDEENLEDGNVSDFFKEHAEEKERKKKKKLKHKKKKKKKSKDGKSPEHKARRLSESSHHHSHGSHYMEPDDRYYDNYFATRKSSRDRSHSPKHQTVLKKPRKVNRDSTVSVDLREKIDKKRLLEIARKNVLTMIEKGTLPSGISSNALAQQQLVTLRAGGKSVAELTEFCKGLVNGKDYLSSDCSDEDGRRRQLSEEEGDTPFINHPFKLKEPLPHIRMNIPNAVQIPVRTADTAKLRQIFPVSSGNQHRIKELEWVPVEKTDTVNATATTMPVLKKNKEAKALIPPPPPPPSTPSQPALNPAPAVFSPQSSQLAIAPPLTTGSSGSLIPMSGPLIDTTAIASSPTPAPVLPVPQTVAPPVIQAEPEAEQPLPPGVDISTIVANRLNAVRRLQENPLDVQALNQMFQAQQQMKDWAHSKLQPGQFGAAPNTRLLTPEELSGPSPVWAKKALSKQNQNFFNSRIYLIASIHQLDFELKIV